MSTKQKLKIIIVEDDAIISQLIESDLHDIGHHVLNIIHKGERAIDTILNQMPDLVLLDVDLSGTVDGIDIGRIINEKTHIPFIYITAFSDLSTLNRAKLTRPCGYLVKPYKPEDLYTAISIGLYNFDHRKQKITIEQVNQLSDEEFTQREYEIIIDITQGLTNVQIAEKQFVSANTIKWHLQNIYSKLNVKNRTSLTKKVFEIK
jgi:DNA-binding NarL/FixJ family response regulator